MDASFSSKARSKRWNDGSTAVVAAIDAERIYVGNGSYNSIKSDDYCWLNFSCCNSIAGDSRSILIQTGGRVIPMSNDHRPERKDEEARIRRLGGKLIHWGRWRVEGVLAVSR